MPTCATISPRSGFATGSAIRSAGTPTRNSYIDGKWVKCTPAFDSALCERAKIKPLDFDGVNDSLFHPFDQAGRRHMEYLKDRGAFADVPFATIVADFKKLYPKLRCRQPDRRELPRRSHDLIFAKAG